jgi:hypothetical protein
MSTKSTSKKEGAAATAARFKVPAPVVKFNRQVLEGQRSLFDSTYEMVTSLQEGSENALQNALEKSRLVPAEVRQIAEAWIGAVRTGRTNFKSAVDKSYDLTEAWFERIAEPEAAEV